MNKKSIIAILATAVLATVAGGVIINAVLNQSISAPSDGTVESSAFIEAYFDGVNWTDGDPLHWGTLEKAGNSKNLTVVNISNVTIVVTLTCDDLPAGWSIAWTGNNTALLKNQSVQGDLTVTVPGIATEGQTYYWTPVVYAEPA